MKLNCCTDVWCTNCACVWVHCAFVRALGVVHHCCYLSYQSALFLLCLSHSLGYWLMCISAHWVRLSARMSEAVNFLMISVQNFRRMHVRQVFHYNFSTKDEQQLLSNIYLTAIAVKHVLRVPFSLYPCSNIRNTGLSSKWQQYISSAVQHFPFNSPHTCNDAFPLMSVWRASQAYSYDSSAGTQKIRTPTPSKHHITILNLCFKACSGYAPHPASPHPLHWHVSKAMHCGQLMNSGTPWRQFFESLGFAPAICDVLWDIFHV